MAEQATPLVYVVDDDVDHAAAVSRLLRRRGYAARGFEAADPMLREHERTPADCVVTDVIMEGASGFVLAERLRRHGPRTAILFMTAWPSSSDAVDSVRRLGGIDYLEKPLDTDRLLSSLAEGIVWSERGRVATMRLSALTHREREVFDLLVKGMSNKAVAVALGISPKTVEDHRAAITAKTGAGNLAQLIALAASQ
ncbi:response regulator transcription factor [Enterovirga sp. GCM10030262]|uniref:response regulator transcription factor n=1 Tax=Enterovirga sp. GCM10030262 TaxID=3273391 RepID=UPI003605C61D